jgi:protein-disulfide isomerase
VSRSQLTILGVAVGAAILAALVYLMFFKGPSGGIASSDSTKAGYSIRPDDRALGSPKARVVVIEYGAPSCPVCARFNEEAIPKLKTAYVDTGKVYYIFRTFPINGAADGAAEALARCAGSGDTYFHFIDVLFRNQKDWDPEFTPDVHAGLLKIAALAAGMDQAKADACMADKASAERINTVAKDAMERYGINGTPTLVINGVVQQAGNTPWPTLKQTLDSFLSKK